MEILQAAYLVLNQSETLWSSGQSDWPLFGGKLNRKLISGLRSNKGIESFWVLVCLQAVADPLMAARKKVKKNQAKEVSRKRKLDRLRPERRLKAPRMQNA